MLNIQVLNLNAKARSLASTACKCMMPVGNINQWRTKLN